MRISTRGRYSLEALLYLTLVPPENAVNTKRISEATGISMGYLEQLFIPLREAGIIRGIRGAQGGNLLARAPGEITVGDILRSVEGSLYPVACIAENSCAMEGECRSRHTWDLLYAEVNEEIDSITLADLVDEFRHGDSMEFTL